VESQIADEAVDRLYAVGRVILEDQRSTSRIFMPRSSRLRSTVRRLSQDRV
jgi:hypothetical protein